MTLFDEDAIQVDAYLDGLLALRTAPMPLPSTSRHRDPALEHASRLVKRALVRFHPSFAFEERLSRRLLDESAAAAIRDTSSATLPEPVPLHAVIGPTPQGSTAPTALDIRGRNGLILGGAIASGVSLAGAAFLAWRRVRGAEHYPERLA